MAPKITPHAFFQKFLEKQPKITPGKWIGHFYNFYKHKGAVIRNIDDGISSPFRPIHDKNVFDAGENIQIREFIIHTTIPENPSPTESEGILVESPSCPFISILDHIKNVLIEHDELQAYYRSIGVTFILNVQALRDLQNGQIVTRGSIAHFHIQYAHPHTNFFPTKEIMDDEEKHRKRLYEKWNGRTGEKITGEQLKFSIDLDHPYWLGMVECDATFHYVFPKTAHEILEAKEWNKVYCKKRRNKKMPFTHRQKNENPLSKIQHL